MAAVGLLAASSLLAAPARAHNPWRTVGFLHREATPDTMVAVTNRGVLLSQDGGGEWRYLCDTAMNSLASVPPIGTGKDSLVWGLFDGTMRTTPSGCDPMDTTGNALDNLWVTDIQLDPLATDGLYAATGTGGGAANAVFHSDDGGASWQPVGTPSADLGFRELRVSHDGSRIYVRALDKSGPTEFYAVRFTDDGGATWESHPLPADDPAAEIDLVGIDPTDPTRVFAAARACRANSSCSPTAPPDRLLRSEDSGATWESILEVGHFGGFEMSDTRMWVGDLDGGLWASDDKGNNFIQLSATQTPECLHLDSTGLYACGVFLTDGFALGRSMDNGKTFEPVMNFVDVNENIACDTDALDVADLCEMGWRDLCVEDFLSDPTPPDYCLPVFMETGADAAVFASGDAGSTDADSGATTGSPDAGVSDGVNDAGNVGVLPDAGVVPSGGGSSGGCSTGGPTPGSRGLAALTLLLAAVLLRRRARA